LGRLAATALGGIAGRAAFSERGVEHFHLLSGVAPERPLLLDVGAHSA